MAEKLLILGAGGHGRALIELLRDLDGLEHFQADWNRGGFRNGSAM